MEEEIKKGVALLGMEYITLEESLLYNESPEVNHIIWSLRAWGDDLPFNYFAKLIEDSIEATRHSYGIVFEPFAIYQEPIVHTPGGDAYFFCRVHLYTRV